jgi:uncharacterized membrane protein
LIAASNLSPSPNSDGRRRDRGAHRCIRHGAENAIRKIEEIPFHVRQLAGLRMATARAWAIPGPEERRDTLTDVKDHPQRKTPFRNKVILVIIIALVLFWYVNSIMNRFQDKKLGVQ